MNILARVPRRFAVVRRTKAAYGKPLGLCADTKLGIALVGFLNLRKQQSERMAVV